MKRAAVILAGLALLVVTPVAAQEQPPYPWSIAWCQWLERTERIPCKYTTPPRRQQVAPGTVTVVAEGWGQRGRSIGWAVIVDNPNTELAATSVPWDVTIYDADGFVLKTASSDFWAVFPGIRSAYFEEITLREGEIAARVESRIRPGRATRLTHNPDITLENVLMRADQFGRFSASMIVRNHGGEDVTSVRVYVVAYNADGNIIGGGWDPIRFVGAQDEFGADARLIVGEQPAWVEVYWTVADLKPFQ